MKIDPIKELVKLIAKIEVQKYLAELKRKKRPIKNKEKST